jgi:hypothetical protein
VNISHLKIYPRIWEVHAPLLWESWAVSYLLY